MENDISSEEKLFVKGVNAGYLLSQHNLKLLQQMSKGTEKKNDYIQGL